MVKRKKKVMTKKNSTNNSFFFYCVKKIITKKFYFTMNLSPVISAILLSIKPFTISEKLGLFVVYKKYLFAFYLKNTLAGNKNCKTLNIFQLTQD